MAYEDYFDPDFGWDAPRFAQQLLIHTRQRLLELGLSEAGAEAHIDSGYVVSESGDIVSDRYYAGFVSLPDGRTRVAAPDFIRTRNSLGCNVWVKRAENFGDCLRHLERFLADDNFVFRGQTRQFLINRPVPNPAFVVAGVGEVSLVPTLWRRMLRSSPRHIHLFETMSLMAWSSIIYSTFDLQRLASQEHSGQELGEGALTIDDMLESDNPITRKLGKFRHGLVHGYNSWLADTLTTLLQHYGLLSPVLDLTTEPAVALFFATHELRCEAPDRSRYDFVGTNGRQAVLYVLRKNKLEMSGYKRDQILSDLNPLRPVRQRCVVVGTDCFCMNLPADFLEGIILLDFDLRDPFGLDFDDLFPGRTDDLFLGAILGDGIGEFATHF